MLEALTCRFVFNVSSISLNKLKAVIQHYKDHGIAERQRKSGGRRVNTRSLTYDDIKAVVTFITNFAEEHALVLPGRVPGFKRSDIRLLPSSETKASVWRKYKSSVELLGNSLSIVMATLCNRTGHYILALWFLLLSSFFSSPNLSRRRLDVCHTCTHGVALV